MFPHGLWGRRGMRVEGRMLEKETESGRQRCEGEGGVSVAKARCVGVQKCPNETQYFTLFPAASPLILELRSQ